MSETNQTPQPRNNWRKYLRALRDVGFAVLGAGVLILLSFIIHWGTKPASTADISDIALDWNKTIEALGIEPIYPPEEDFHVGDLFVAITASQVEDLAKIPLTARAIKIAHIDMNKDLREEYEQMPVFPATIPKPASIDIIWEQAQADKEIFSGSTQDRRYLPLVIFPGFALARVRQATVSGNWSDTVFGGVYKLASALSITQSSDDAVELRVPFAETYGIPSVRAAGHLISFCSDERTKPICTDDFARDQLSLIIGDKIREKTREIIGDKVSETYRFDVELYLVNRVYLTRNIEQRHSTTSTVGAQAKLVLNLRAAADAEAAIQKSVATGTPGSAEISAASDPTSRLRQLIADQQARLNDLANEAASGLPSGQVEVNSADSSRISISQILQRPVAIGFRAIHKRLLTTSSAGQ
jgi:hypothetical protein